MKEVIIVTKEIMNLGFTIMFRVEIQE